MQKVVCFLLLFFSFFNLPDLTAKTIAEGDVVVSILPVHSVVSAIMDGVGKPLLLLSGDVSPHSFQMTPSQVRAIKNAKVIIWIGSSYAKPLYPYLRDLKDRKVLSLQEKVDLLPLRVGALWDESSGCSHHDHEENHENLDGHIWLDPRMMIQVVDVVLEFLVAHYPEHKHRLEKNAKKYRKRLEKLHENLVKKMKPYIGYTYIMQHDGNQYFDNAYGTKTIATISIDASVPVCAGHMLRLRQAITDNEINPKCLFAELQMNGDLAKKYADTLGIHCGVLDYLGAGIEPGIDAYEELMQKYTDAFISGLEGRHVPDL